VSISTVSRALSGSPLIPEATRDMIAEIAKTQGYVINPFARGLRLQRTQTIGVVIPLGHGGGQLITDPFFLEMLGRLADEITLRGYEILLSKIAPPNPGWLDRLIQAQRTDGLVIIGQSDQHEALNLAAEDRPRGNLDEVAVVVRHIAEHECGSVLPGEQPQCVGVNFRDEIAVALFPVGEGVARHGIEIDVGPEEVVTAFRAVFGHRLCEEWCGDALADGTPVEIREAHDDRVNGSRSDRVVEFMESGHAPLLPIPRGGADCTPTRCAPRRVAP